MDNTLDLTIIIPVGNVNNDVDKQLIGLTINSVFQQKNFLPRTLLFVSSIETKTNILDNIVYNDTPLSKEKSFNGVEIKFVINEKADNYQSQINTAVKETETEYFMVLDSDDELSNILLDNLNKHMKLSKDMYLTLLADCDLEKNVHRYINEICWAKDVTGDRHGQLTMELLMNYNLVSINGAAIRKEKFLEVGGLKESFQLSFVYEFLMRFVNNDGTAYTIPKIGYIRKNGREGSYLDQLYKVMGEDEVKFWWALSKKEYVWPHDRNKSYVPKKEEVVV